MQECKFFAKIKDSALYSSALACFKTKEDASAYIKSGAIDKVLPYKAAGDWCTPSLPDLRGKYVAEEAQVSLTHQAAKRFDLGPLRATLESENPRLIFSPAAASAPQVGLAAAVPGCSTFSAAGYARGSGRPSISGYKPTANVPALYVDNPDDDSDEDFDRLSEN